MGFWTRIRTLFYWARIYICPSAYVIFVRCGCVFFFFFETELEWWCLVLFGRVEVEGFHYGIALWYGTLKVALLYLSTAGGCFDSRAAHESFFVRSSVRRVCCSLGHTCVYCLLTVKRLTFILALSTSRGRRDDRAGRLSYASVVPAPSSLCVFAASSESLI